ncbi:type III helper protein HopAK1 [Pseudomonas floridensis]|uniref:Type III helper protein HopAK1 n=1 Tax=Pseudomonas floridensis TaxID=1958950 RepID=A0A1X0N2R9_9PSED|nr:type III helper protein HopAK1 [Pseudomonas floridensis]ORC57797.1 type III helper protein HopAK1 [Pseudomonas floridensis]
MASINRSFNSVPDIPTVTSAKPEQDNALSQLQLRPTYNHSSTQIDFGPPQRVSGPQSSIADLRAGARPFHANPLSSSPQGAGGALTLNKLVEAIRSILSEIKELFTRLLGNQRQRPMEASNPQAENPTGTDNPSFKPAMLSSTSPSSAPVTPGSQAEKPFEVRNAQPADQPQAMPKNTIEAPPGKPVSQPRKTEQTDAEPYKTPVSHDPVKAPVIKEPELSKVTPPANEHANITPQPKPTPVAHQPAGNGTGADMSGIVGFAKEAKTTGGNGGEVVTVNTVEELQKSMADDKTRTVRLGADLSADSKVTVKFGANKTLLGTDKGNELHNIYLASGETAGNDIFQNLNFSHDARYRENGDMQMFISNGGRYWIDHDTFTGTKDQKPKGLDKLLYVGGKADNVTLTNSKFQNNEYGVILGQPDDSAAAKAEYKGYPRMTIANNSFNNLDVRAPGLMRHGDFDVYNNRIDNFHLGFTATGDATILSQSNYFEKGVDVNNKSSNQGVLDDYGDAHFKDIGSNVSFTQKSPVTVWTPPYQRDVMTAEAARAYVLANAGAHP